MPENTACIQSEPVVPQSPQSREAQGRLRLLDALRGFSLVSMVCFHLCYDLVYLYGVSIAWFRPPLQDIWRSSISWTFLLLAGIMCSLSRSNLKRAAKYGAFALAIWLITSIAAVDAPINFGIIYCMAFSTFVVWVLERCHAVPCGPLCALVFFVLFLFAYRIPQGYVGIGPATFAVPRALYEGNALSFLGFPGPTFFSSDYYPPLPFTLLYLSGCSLGRWWRKTGFPSALTVYGCVPLEFIGRHSLLVYAIHQPVLLGILYLAFG